MNVLPVMRRKGAEMAEVNGRTEARDTNKSTVVVFMLLIVVIVIVDEWRRFAAGKIRAR